MALDKVFDEIDEVDLRQLIENNVSEQKTVEYKELLPENNRESKKEFLADVSSFANTVGGHIIFGIKEESGIPVELSGLESDDFDSEILRLENLLRDSIQPRIQGISMKAIPIEGSKPIIFLRIPQSWSKPHVVNFQGHWRFYARNSAGKYPLDVTELQSAFLASTAIIERIKHFRFERISKIVANETPIPLSNSSKVILHLVPFVAFESGFSIQVSSLQKEAPSLKPLYSYVGKFRYNLDGIVAYDNRRDEQSEGYFQVFRNGIIEIVSESMIDADANGPYIPSIVVERELIDALRTCIDIYKKFQISSPFALMLTFTGVKNCRLAVNLERLDPWRQHTYKIDRDPLIISEIMVENYSDDPANILRPIFDAVWNSAGWPKSMGYDENGEWGKGPNFR